MAIAQSEAISSKNILTQKLIQNVLWSVWVILLMVYSVMAFQYFIAFMAGEREWWYQLQAYLVSEHFAFGEGSGHLEQREPYQFNRYLLFVHTTMGALCLAIGWTQFVSKWRSNYPIVHRTIGKIYLTTVLLAMTFGLLHLATVPLRSVFSGAAFAIGLWGLDFLVIASAILAYHAIRSKDFRGHQGWMVFNYALLGTTPALRFFWVTIGATTDLNQSQINSGIATVLVPTCLIFGMIWFSSEYLRDRRADPS